MKLNLENLINNQKFWNDNNISIPKYDILKVRKNTNENPRWIHFGAGNIFRCFIARIVDTLLDEGLMDSGIIAVDTHATGVDTDYDMIEKVYKPFDNLSLLSFINGNGNIDMKVIGSITEVLHADFINYYEKLKNIFIKESLQIISFTITEKGYTIKDTNNNFIKTVSLDIKNHPSKAKNIISIITALLLERYNNGAFPVTILSADNCSKNGDKLKNAILEIAMEWKNNGFTDSNFIEYIKNKVSSPITMIDKITPRPSPIISDKLKNLNFDDMDIFKVGNNFMAGFVNTEVPEYFVVEDNFSNGKPDLASAGVYITDIETVEKTEKMKVTTCLNPLHTCLAIFGCLLNYNFIYEEMRDEDIKRLINKLAYDEGMKVVVDPKIISPKDFIKEVIEERFPNEFIPDSPQRIATDTSQKIPVRYGETLKSYIEKGLDISSLIAIPITIAAWIRYLMGIDDDGNEIEISPDPMFDELNKYISKIKFGDINSVQNNLKDILSNKNIFALDLYDSNVNLGEKVELYFKEMISGTGAIKNCLKKYII